MYNTNKKIIYLKINPKKYYKLCLKKIVFLEKLLTYKYLINNDNNYDVSSRQIAVYNSCFDHFNISKFKIEDSIHYSYTEIVDFIHDSGALHEGFNLTEINLLREMILFLKNKLYENI